MIKKHYTVTVQVKEVTPGYIEGTGSNAVRHDRAVEDVINISVRAEDEEDAVRLAMQQLTALGGRS